MQIKNYIYIKPIHIITTLLILNILLGGTTGKISGVISDEDNKPLVGCNMVLDGTSMGSSSDINGQYYIINIPAGKYSLTATMIGYKTIKLKDIIISSDFTTPVDLTMQIEAIAGETITVIAKQNKIVKDLTSSTAIVNSDDLELLPITEISEVLEIQAGYVDGHLRGGRSGEVSYLIDGIAVTDAYDGNAATSINKNSIEEMQIISGAFNAEYGHAMSGIVNIITKDGSNKTSGHLSNYFGDFISNKSSLFLNIDDIDIFSTKNIDLSLNGPIIKDKLFYFTNFRNIKYEGHYNGLRKFNYDNISYFDSTGTFIISKPKIVSGDTSFPGLGNQDFVPMDWNQHNYFQLKLLYKPSPSSRLRITRINDDRLSQYFDRMYKYNPDGSLLHENKSITNIFQLTKNLTKNTYLNFGITNFKKVYKHFTFEDPSKYVHQEVNTSRPYSFYTGGNNNSYFNRETNSAIIKADLSSQIKNNLLKIGFESRNHKINYYSSSYQPSIDQISFNPETDDPFLIKPILPNDTTIYSSRFTFEPIELSMYIQNKLELNNLIINAGIRFDYFDPKGNLLSDPTDPSIYNPIKPGNRYRDLNNNGIKDTNEPTISSSERQEYWYLETDIKYKISPRLGISFPISDAGVFHFSYGHFFQMPKFELLYLNPDFDLSQSTGNTGVIGNANLNPEKTISAEIGLQQQLNRQYIVNITCYFRDIRELTGTRSSEIEMFGGASSYSKLENSDFAFVKGLVLSLDYNNEKGLFGTIDYTLQNAVGTASDPFQAQNSLSNNQLPEIQIVPLDWDQTHTLNATFGLTNPIFGTYSIIARLGSGLPYTPENSVDISSLIYNSSRKPVTHTIDLKASKKIKLKNYRINLFVRVKNLFDHLNENIVYNDSGQAGYTRKLKLAQSQNTDESINTVDEWYNNETFYSNPRRVEIGLDINF